MPIEFGLLLPAVSSKVNPDGFLSEIRAYAPRLVGHIQSLWMTDHFMWGDQPTYEAWTAISYLSALYPQYQLGSLVLGQGYRNPAMLAKMGATLQTLSGGRLILGLGAGWKEDEYHAYGYPFPSASERIHQLEEAIIIIKRLWYDADPVDYYGRHYRIKEASCVPKPNPVPPIMIGGAGQMTLRVVAQHANWWNFSGATPQLYGEKLLQLKHHCDYMGRQLSEIRLTWLGKIAVAATKRKKLDNTLPLHGTVDQIVEQIMPYIELGIDYFILESAQLEDKGTVELLAEEVLPKLRSLVP